MLALADLGFDYLFNSVKWWDFKRPWLLEQYEAFRHIAPSIGFPESHDTDRLVSELLAAGIRGSEIEWHYRHAYAFAAAYSTGVMMPMGFEYGWSRSLDVVGRRDDGPEPRRFDLSEFIAEVNAMKKAIPALNEEGPQRLLTNRGDSLVPHQRPWPPAAARPSPRRHTPPTRRLPPVAGELLPCDQLVTLLPFGYARAIGSRDLGGTDALPKLHGRKRSNEALLRPVRRGSAGSLPGLRL